jgi:hypothetical protein
MEEKLYGILRKHKLPLKKREEMMVDLLDLFSVSGSLPDTKGDKIRKHINPTNHFIDWLIDNGQPQFKVLYDN